MYEFYVKQKIEAGLRAAAEGRTVPHEEIKSRLLERKQPKYGSRILAAEEVKP
jgi:predicted transcriptional regulator